MCGGFPFAQMKNNKQTIRGDTGYGSPSFRVHPVLSGGRIFSAILFA